MTKNHTQLQFKDYILYFRPAVLTLNSVNRRGLNTILSCKMAETSYVSRMTGIELSVPNSFAPAVKP